MPFRRLYSLKIVHSNNFTVKDLSYSGRSINEGAFECTRQIRHHNKIFGGERSYFTGIQLSIGIRLLIHGANQLSKYVFFPAVRPFGTHAIVKDIKLKEDINEKGKCTFLKLVSSKLKLNCLNVGSADFKPRRTKRVECL